ncbi:hypothetical protein [Aphanothece hegewaldii]|uniref:hypothetical protein n=1 Tax=Aphanothece hegewaldii TaxID=1521625 RepID=UPI0015E75AF8|nr:hypothetical protein [Aphanothece hegewaldii]
MMINLEKGCGMERFMHQLSVLIISTSLGLFFLSTYSLKSDQGNLSETLSEKASVISDL